MSQDDKDVKDLKRIAEDPECWGDNPLPDSKSPMQGDGSTIVMFFKNTPKNLKKAEDVCGDGSQ